MATVSTLMPITDVVALLAARVAALVPDLLPQGNRRGAEWVCGDLTGAPGQSLAVHMTGVKSGIWMDFAAGIGGDVLDLVTHARFGGDKKAALRWARGYLGLDGPSVLPPAKLKAEAAAAIARRDRDDAADQEKRMRAARAIWLEAVPIGGTPAALYLEARGITLAGLGGRWPGALRYHPDLWCGEASIRLPALVAAINGPDGQHIATHRTWIGPCANPPRPVVWRKALLTNPKLTLGTYAGGYIRLTRGGSGKPWTALDSSDTVAIAEGIETALSVAVLVPEWRVLAAVSLANIGRLKLPPAARRIIVCADNDRPGSPAADGKERALKHLLATGAEVRLAHPDIPYKDWNDQLIAEQAGKS